MLAESFVNSRTPLPPPKKKTHGSSIRLDTYRLVSGLEAQRLSLLMLIYADSCCNAPSMPSLGIILSKVLQADGALLTLRLLRLCRAARLRAGLQGTLGGRLGGLDQTHAQQPAEKIGQADDVHEHEDLLQNHMGKKYG